MSGCHHHRLTKQCFECAREKDGAELVREAAQSPELDPALRKDLRDVGPDDFPRLVQKFRLERSFIKGKRGNG